ncbi:unnamed protein product [Echinostoma caproni]|uniref:PseudoU_synth_2 domain-containing protein n=1 Tax=Echinostoma caproni TaxID=27848 RepID=A0A183AIG4_9TREM|nr:unnamed protein product [Echinostoma caproni]
MRKIGLLAHLLQTSPTPIEISKTNKRKGLILEKYIGHQLLCTNQKDACVITVQANSSYRGLPEVYLLQEGCRVIGELIQSSRLIDTGVGKIVLHPSRVNLQQSPWASLRKRLKYLDDRLIPVHMHRFSLLIPIPLAGINAKSGDYFRPLVPRPRGKIESKISNECVLSWLQLRAPGAEDAQCVRYALKCQSPSLPVHLDRTIQCLDLPFDYTQWIASREIKE